MKNFQLTIEQVNGDQLVKVVTGAETLGAAKTYGKKVATVLGKGFTVTTIVEV